MKPAELIEKLAKALQEAEEHLEYTGYGDSWERECAMESGLDTKIDDALAAYKSWKKEIN